MSKKAFIKTEEIEEDERLQKQCEDNERKINEYFAKRNGNDSEKDSENDSSNNEDSDKEEEIEQNNNEESEKDE